MNFSVEEENLICMYHTEMRRLANGTIAKLERMTDVDFDGQRFDFTGE